MCRRRRAAPRRRFFGELRPAVAHRSAAAAAALQGAGLLAAGAGMLRGRRGCAGGGEAAAAAATRRALLAAAGATALGGLYWAVAMGALRRRYGPELGAVWHLSWLPAAPLAVVGLCAYVLRALRGSDEELRQLRGLRYRLKGA